VRGLRATMFNEGQFAADGPGDGAGLSGLPPESIEDRSMSGDRRIPATGRTGNHVRAEVLRRTVDRRTSGCTRMQFVLRENDFRL
jgi:hypothetical protein